MAGKKYYFVGSHADTLYQGDNCVPVGHGMEPIEISDADMNDERNAGVKDSFVEVEASTAETKKGGEK